jgi:hypothetical protein
MDPLRGSIPIVPLGEPQRWDLQWPRLWTPLEGVQRNNYALREGKKEKKEEKKKDEKMLA